MEENKFPRRGQIWTVNYNFEPSGLYSGEEQRMIESQTRKSRLCLIISSCMYNKSSEWILAIPLVNSTGEEIIEPLEVLIKADEHNHLSSDGKLMIRFINSLSKNLRLGNPIGFASKEIMERVTNKLVTLVS